MMDLWTSFDRAERTIRIPDRQSVAVPKCFEAIVDHSDFQRLRNVRMLGPIHLVYPGAMHTRFEHSLGVFSSAAAYLRRLSFVPEFRERVDEPDALVLLAAALLHDIGHYPFAHSLEALHSGAFKAPRHEDLAAQMILGRLSSSTHGPSLGDVIEDCLGVPRERVAGIVEHGSSGVLGPVDRLLGSIISSAIDCDKLDYLGRDSYHMGIPYGRMPDRERLLAGLCVNLSGDRIALTEKGRVSGEIFLFARHLMFSEAYWHHTVRSACAMVEAAMADFLASARPSPDGFAALLLGMNDEELLETVRRGGRPGSEAEQLLQGITDHSRGLYKRVLTMSREREETEYHRAYDVIYQMNRPELAALRKDVLEVLRPIVKRTIEPHEVLIDTPPRDKDKLDSIEVIFNGPDGASAVPLESVSRVVRGVAVDFIKVVKKIRVFVSPSVRLSLSGQERVVEQALLELILSKAGASGEPE
ncbi:MAG: HD domain-containing protein [Myxococcales bacterium]|nr:HD domain-containing protein [Myxococcales bacterium]